ncbi:MAG: GntR family transcriptional regulator [Chloroflexi bacterium]|nr:GntR family transcriptional regulator [Chloroflexota bacterium]
MKLSNQAYENIRRDILTCRLVPGSQIVQSQLTEQYQTGMTPVREALQRLAHEGLLTPVPRSGYIVSPVTYSGIRELFELRSILESAAVRLAALRGTEEQLRRILTLADFTYRYNDWEDYTRFLSLNADFHTAIAALSGNQRLAETLSKLLDELTRVFHLGLDLKDSAEEMRDEHLALAKALLKRDDDLAVKIVQSQIARSAERVSEAVMNNVRSGLTGHTGPDAGQISPVFDTLTLGGKFS